MQKIPIIYFHSVALHQNPLWNRSYLTFKLNYFEDLLRYLVRNDFHFISLAEYFEFRKDGKRINKKLICLTFDDGYLDNYVYAYPLLKKYRAKATIFVNPDYIQENDYLRPTLEDVWECRIDLNYLLSLGFVSWSELKVMQDSGVMDVQSHTLTHAKYFVSDKIRDFHNPKSDYLNPISNIFPSKKPYYITDPGFMKLIPWGTPFFEEKSAIIAKRVAINENFQKECVDILKGTDWHNYDFESNLNKIKPLYNSYRSAKKLVTYVESNQEYEERVRKELKDSKLILEKRLGKPVSHCCWPNGDYNSFAHQAAIAEGYISTGIVLKPGEENGARDRFDRIGSGVVMNSRFLTLLKNIYKINAYRSIFPYQFIQSFIYWVKYGVK